MATECIRSSFDFQPLGARQVTGRFNGGTITSDAGALLLREVEARTGILRGFARCFDDFRDPEIIEFTVEELLKQRVMALALGYEDLNDHEQLRRDPLLAVLVGRDDPTGQDRADPRDRGAPLAGKSTLNRLELIPPRASLKSRYKKIAARHERIEAFFVETFLNLAGPPPEEIVLDFDANPRFVVTSLSAEQCDARTLYERRYCGRGDMENRIKEQQRCLFADRTSCHTMRANQLRLWLSSVAYVLLQALREHGLRDTPLARAQCDTIRLKLLKIGALVSVTVRRVWFCLAESCPYQSLFAQAFANLQMWRPLPPTAAPA